jgi:uncharacterized protein YbjT (DUF2867 family)
VVRDRSRAVELEAAGCELWEGDALDADSLRGAGEGVDTAYFLIHSMGGGGGFAEREGATARNVARMARLENVQRLVYLGGLGEPDSEHLRSRQATAEVLAEHGPPLTYFRAGMVVGAESASFSILYHLVRRLPVMVTPAWLRTRTQPIGIDDVIAYLEAAPERPAGEVQIGGPDVLAYEAMLDVVARALGRRPPVKVPVPLLSPRLSSLWVGLMTPADTGLARALVDSLRVETIVTDPSGMARFDIEPAPFAETVQSALK